MLVEEIMTPNVVKIDCKKTVYDACKVYSEKRVGSLVVMDRDIIVGIITERDAIEKVILDDKNPKKTKVAEIMTPNIKTVHALAPLEKAAQIMKNNNIKKLPVVLNNEIVGIVTETDLSRTIEAFSEAVEELTQFYADSRENLEKMMDEWGNILVGLKEHRKLIESKNLEGLRES
jgi:CBS domain-containing protein